MCEKVLVRAIKTKPEFNRPWTIGPKFIEISFIVDVFNARLF